MFIASFFESLLFAAATAPPPDVSGPSSQFTGNVVLVCLLVGGQILSLFFGGVGLWISARRTPPVAEEMHRTFVPRREWDESVQRLHHRIDETKEQIVASQAVMGAKIDSLRTDMTKVFHDVERTLGRIEGRQENQG